MHEKVVSDDLDPIFHTRGRLLVMIDMVESQDGSASFSELNAGRGGGGSLAFHLNALERDGVLKVDRSPRSMRAELTKDGRARFFAYLEALGKLIKSVKRRP